MTRILKKRSRKIGLSPGSLVHYGEQRLEEIRFSLTEYSPNTITTKTNASLQDCLDSTAKPDCVSWIEVKGVHDPKIIEAIGGGFKLHPLLLEDVISTAQRCKMDVYIDHIFIVVRAISYSEEKDDVEDEQVSLVLGEHYVISFVESGNGFFSPIHERLRRTCSRLRTNGPDYLCYALIDCLVDHYFAILEKVDDHLEALDKELVGVTNKTTLARIQRAKRTVMHLRKSVWPMREVISEFRRVETPLIKPATNVFMQDVYDHTIQAIDTIESFRDLATGMIDVYLSNINQRMNEIMKVLTVMATIFAPITFISSLYGMNFDYMPELHMRYGYPAVLAVMAIIILIMITFFRRHRWI